MYSKYTSKYVELTKRWMPRKSSQMLPKTPIAGVQKVRQVHYISRFVYLGKKLLNRSIFRQAHLLSFEKA